MRWERQLDLPGHTRRQQIPSRLHLRRQDEHADCERPWLHGRNKGHLQMESRESDCLISTGPFGRPQALRRANTPFSTSQTLFQFKAIVPRRDFTSPDYMDKVKQFRVGTQDAENLFASLIIRSLQGTPGSPPSNRRRRRVPPLAPDSLRGTTRQGRFWGCELCVERDDKRGVCREVRRCRSSSRTAK